jgi:hypothetical protein
MNIFRLLMMYIRLAKTNCFKFESDRTEMIFLGFSEKLLAGNSRVGLKPKYKGARPVAK